MPLKLRGGPPPGLGARREIGDAPSRAPSFMTPLLCLSFVPLAGAACRTTWPGERHLAEPHVRNVKIAFSETGYVEIDERLRVALPELVRLDGHGHARPREEVLGACVPPALGGRADALPIVDATLPRALCVAQMESGTPGTGAFLRVYLDPTAAAGRIAAYVGDRLPAAAREADAERVEVAPLAHGLWRGVRGRWQTRDAEARRTTEADFIVIPRAGGGAFVVASSVFDATRLELSQRAPERR